MVRFKKNNVFLGSTEAYLERGTIHGKRKKKVNEQFQKNVEKYRREENAAGTSRVVSSKSNAY